MAKLQLEIVTPESKAFSEEVDMVVLPGVEGELGILPLHVPLMTRLLPGEVRITQGPKQIELVVGNGFVEVTRVFLPRETLQRQKQRKSVFNIAAHDVKSP